MCAPMNLHPHVVHIWFKMYMPLACAELGLQAEGGVVNESGDE